MIDVYTLDTRFFSAREKPVRVELLLNKIFAEKGLSLPAEIEKNRWGKPFLKNIPGLHFNGSHSGHYLVCALSHRPVGVDVQRVDREKPVLALARRFMASGEADRLENLAEDDRIQAFYRLWAQKESYMKYRGLGFALPLNAFEIQERAGGYRVIDEKGSEAPVFLRPLDLAAGYELWVCGEEPDIQKFEFGIG